MERLSRSHRRQCRTPSTVSVRISGLVVEYNVAIVVTRVRFPADAKSFLDWPDL